MLGLLILATADGSSGGSQVDISDASGAGDLLGKAICANV